MTSAGNTQAMAGSGPGFMDTLASEWTKMRSLRGTYLMVILSIVLSVGLTALVAVVTGSTFDEWNASDQANFEPTLFSFFGSIFSGIIFAVLGVTFMTSEYSSGMIRLTLTVTPKRGRVLLAKVLVVTAVTLVVGTVVVFLCYFVAQAAFGSYDMPTSSLGDSDTQRALIAASLLGPLFPVIGLCIGVFLRSTAGGITAILALLFAPAIFSGLFPEWWQENVLSLLPGNAGDSVIIGHLQDAPVYLGVGPALLVVAAWVAIFVGGAYYVINRRDA